MHRSFRLIAVYSMLCLTSYPLAGAAPSLGEGSARPVSSSVRFDTNAVTDAHVDLSPDGTTLIFDALGTIYSAPVEGGRATALTHGSAWNIRPRYSPDGNRMAFLSDRDGAFEPWISEATGYDSRPVPIHDESVSWLDRSRLEWTSAGSLAMKAQTVKGGRAWTYDQDSGLREVTAAPNWFMELGKVSPDGKIRYFGGDALYRLDIESGEVTPVQSYGSDAYVFGLQLSRDGNVLSYFVKKDEEKDEESYQAPARFHVANLKTRIYKEVEAGSRMCPLGGGGRGDCEIPSYAISHDGKTVFINMDGRIIRIDTEYGRKETVPITVPVDRIAHRLQSTMAISPNGRIRANAIRWPDISADHSLVTFNAFSRVYVKDLRSGAEIRIAEETGPQSAAAISPDGKRIAFTTWPSQAGGHLMVASVDGGSPVRLTDEPGWYLNPTWSHDGSMIAFVSNEKGGAVAEGSDDSHRVIQLQIVGAAGTSMPRIIAEFAPAYSGAGRQFYPQPTFQHGDQRLTLIALTSSQKRWDELQAAIVSFDVNTGQRTEHLSIPRFDEGVVSPDGRHLAFVMQGELRLLPLDVMRSEADSEEFSDVSRLAGGAPVHVRWKGPESIVWADGNNIYTYGLKQDRPVQVASTDVDAAVLRPEGCLVYRGARLVTMSDAGVIEGGRIKVCGDRIVELGHAGALDAEGAVPELDLAGATIIPGLIDAHGHFDHAQQDVWPRPSMEYMGSLAFGVTTVYDPQSATLDAAAKAEMFAIGEQIGPRLLSAGTAIMGRLHVAAHHFAMGTRGSSDHIESIVDNRTRHVSGPLKSYEDSRRDSRQTLAEAASRAGVLVTSHPYSYEDALSSTLDGLSIEHAIDIKRDGMEIHDDVLQFVASTGVAYTIEDNGVGFYSVDEADPRFGNLFSKTFFENKLREINSNSTPETKIRRLKSSELMARFARMGGLATLGAHGNYIPGLTLHHNMWALVDNGLEPQEALRVLTVNGAKKLGLDSEIGSLGPGKLADFIVLRSNPLDNIRNSADVKYVVKGGILYNSSTLEVVHPER